MYGQMPRLEELDRRKAGPAGDQAHLDTIVEHQAELKTQAELDEQKKDPEQEQPEVP